MEEENNGMELVDFEPMDVSLLLIFYKRMC